MVAVSVFLNSPVIVSDGMAALFWLKQPSIKGYTMACYVAGVAQLVRALDCGSRGPGFEPQPRYHSVMVMTLPTASGC